MEDDTLSAACDTCVFVLGSKRLPHFLASSTSVMDLSKSPVLRCPPEIIHFIAMYLPAPTSPTLKSLSLTCRALQTIAQSILLESVKVLLRSEWRPNACVNALVTTSVRRLAVVGPNRLRERLCAVESILLKLLALKSICLSCLQLDAPLLGAVLEVAAQKPLQLELQYVSILHSPTFASGPLLITSLFVASNSYHKKYAANLQTLIEHLCRASSDSIEELRLNTDEKYLTVLVDLPMPCLSKVSLRAPPDGVAAFLKKHPSITFLELMADSIYPLSLPMDALPKLRELRAWPYVINALVRCRPIHSLTIHTIYPKAKLLDSIKTSTRPIETLHLHFISSATSTLAWLRQAQDLLPMLRRFQFYPFMEVCGIRVVEAHQSHIISRTSTKRQSSLVA